MAVFFFFQAEDGIRDDLVTGVQTCALPICSPRAFSRARYFAIRVVRITHQSIEPAKTPAANVSDCEAEAIDATDAKMPAKRSEERRVGKEGRSRGSPDH